MNGYTLRQPIFIQGAGIHDGQEAVMEILPASSPGIIFTVSYSRKKISFPLSLATVKKTERYTGIGKRRVVLKTVEHFLSACYGLSIVGLKVKVKGSELPAGDGSAWFFAQLLLKAGRKKICSTKEISLAQPLSLGEKMCRIIAYPCPRLRILFCLFPPYPEKSLQTFDFVFSEKRYLEKIAPARTFCTYREIQKLKREGLGKGGNRENTLVMTRQGFYNKPRFPDEPVRHKILDFLGDMSILGSRINGFFICLGSGHSLNYQLLKKLSRR